MTEQSDNTDKVHRREDAAHFWSTHDITVDNSEEVEEEICARAPLAASISLRLNDEEMAQLRTMAKAEDVGVTTMARILLRAGLDKYSQAAGRFQELEVVDAEPISLRSKAASASRRTLRST